MNLKKNIERVPGGMMIIPLFLGVVVNSFFPQALDIGGLTTSLARGSSTLIAAFLLCMGAGIQFRSMPKSLLKGSAITLSKFGVAVGIGMLVSIFFQDKTMLGLSALAIIAGMSNTNGGLFAALVSESGDESDVGSIAILSLNDGPFLTMLALGATGLASFPFLTIISFLIPLLAGIILGNLDPEMRKFLLTGGYVLIPFFAFALGAGLSFEDIFQAGFPGVLLGLLTVFVGGFFNILADKVAGGTGLAGAAASSVAGNAVATPSALALADPSLQEYVSAATSQIAAAVVTTAIFTPLLTQYIAKTKTVKTSLDQR